MYRSKDRRFTLIIDRRKSGASSIEESRNWLAMTTPERQKIFDFLRMLESSGEIEIDPNVARSGEILKTLDSLRAVLEESDSQSDLEMKKAYVTLHLLDGLVIALALAVCGVMFARADYPLSVPIGFAAVIFGFTTLMTYVGRRMHTDHPPRWIRWLNSIRECLANEPQTAGGTW